MIGALFVGDHLSGRPNRPQQRQGQSTGSGSCLQHPRAGKYVALMHDLGRIFGIDHLRAARHRHDVVDQQRAQHQEQGAVAGFDHAALLQPDHRVVGDRATMSVEFGTGSQRHGVAAPLSVGELNTFADAEWAGC
ncbi:Uncharacterised protein [Mycobacterium tuberculosis]|nr:Uncharacterised protein [Mycobacterium tuberculosis]